ncbi:hypothetical protein HDV05_000820, partial [Chytridiales sp. JEL 0842]
MRCCSNASPTAAPTSAPFRKQNATYDVKLISFDEAETVCVEICESHSVFYTLLFEGFFPSSPEFPEYAISTKLLQVADRMNVEAGVSKKGCHKILVNFNSGLYSHRDTGLSQTATGETLNAKLFHKPHCSYSVFKKTLRRFQEGLRRAGQGCVSEDILNALKERGLSRTLCACTGDGCDYCKTGGPWKRFLDGCFAPKKDSVAKGGGSSYGRSHLGQELELTIPPDLLRSSSDDRDESAECSNTKSGSLKRKADANSDVNGVFCSCCRHYNVDLMIDIPKGEGLIYAKTALKKLYELYECGQLILCYDIACKLKLHLDNMAKAAIENNGDNPNPKSPYLSVIGAMHTYNHSVDCQAKYGTHLVLGAGMEDGEHMERVWAMLKKLICAMRKSTVEHRWDQLFLITEHNHQKNQAKLIPNLRKVVQKTIKRADQLQHHVSVSAAAGTFMEFFKAYQQAVADNCNIRREAL